MATKYNPDFHSNVVRNLRSMWKDHVGPKDSLFLSDEEIWNIFDEFCNVEAVKEDFPEIENRYDAAVLVEMEFHNAGLGG